MTNEGKLTRDITGSHRAEIVGSPEVINGPLFAINWFNTRLAFVYHFYNLLAGSRVFKVGGKVLFKGKCEEAIGGDSEMARQFLLIVNYPSGSRFIDLLADRIFQMMSVFRVMAVKQFSFVFHARKEIHQTPDAGQPFNANDCYAVLHFKELTAEAFEDRLSILARIALSHETEIFFAGRVAGQVVIANTSSGEQNPMPFITGCTVLLKNSNRQAMSGLFESAEMRALLNDESGYFASYIKRTM